MAEAETFDYTGRAYVRPNVRGICLLDGSEDQLEEQMNEGFWHLTVTARRLTKVLSPQDGGAE